MTTHERDDAGPASNPRDAALERAWRDASVEQPPDALDATILAAARKAVSTAGASAAATPHRARPWRGPARWHSLLAAAAVAGLAFVLVPRTANVPPAGRDAASSTARQESLAAPAEKRSPSAETAAPAEDMSAERRAPVAGDTPPARARPDGPRDDASPTSLPGIPPPPAAPTAPAVPDVGAEASAVAGETQRAVASPAPQVSSSEGRAGEEALGSGSVEWAARIEALHAAGELAAAARELKSFRAAVPDAEAYLSPSLREWARTVQ